MPVNGATDMKVLHINSYYTKGDFYKMLFDRQIANGTDVSVFVPAFVDADSLNVKLADYICISKNHGKYDRIFFNIKHNKIYADIIAKYAIKNYSLMHAHSLFTNGSVAYKLKKEYGIPYIVAVRDTDCNTFFKYMLHLRKLGVKILNEADRIIFLSQTYKNLTAEKYVPNKYRKEILSKSEVVPNGIDDFYFENDFLHRQCAVNPHLKIITVGLLYSRKNQKTVCKAVKELQKRGVPVEYTVIGKIENHRYYRSIIKYPFVKYKPPVPKEDLINEYRQADIYVMPSLRETFGLVYAEAMSQNLPVIYTKGQGFDSQFEEGTVGYHVEARNVAQITNAIEKVMSDYETISKNCRTAAEKFNWDTVASKYEKIYACVLKDK